MKKELDYFMIDGEFGGVRTGLRMLLCISAGVGLQLPATAVFILQNIKE